MIPSNSGILYIVSTPIGNLKDITIRAQEILTGVDQVLAEDTRQTMKLLSHLQIRTRITSFHEHSSPRKREKIISELEQGKSFALVSDGGTPLLSDPGFRLVRESVSRQIQVVPIPGPSALLAALVASGAPMDSFVFEGFLPPKGSSRKKKLERIAQEERTQVLYEAPYRLLKLLNDLNHYLSPGRNLILAREITKIYEEFMSKSIQDLIAYFETTNPRGEFVIIIPKEKGKRDA